MHYTAFLTAFPTKYLARQEAHHIGRSHQAGMAMYPHRCSPLCPPHPPLSPPAVLRTTKQFVCWRYGEAETMVPCAARDGEPRHPGIPQRDTRRVEDTPFCRKMRPPRQKRPHRSLPCPPYAPCVRERLLASEGGRVDRHRDLGYERGARMPVHVEMYSQPQ